MDVDAVFRYLRHVLRGLEHLHRAGVFHLDIKPRNLMISADERIKIIDFGLCTVHGEARYDTHQQWEGKVQLGYLINKDFSVLANYHSEYGIGAGLQVRL